LTSANERKGKKKKREKEGEGGGTGTIRAYSKRGNDSVSTLNERYRSTSGNDRKEKREEKKKEKGEVKKVALVQLIFGRDTSSSIAADRNCTEGGKGGGKKEGGGIEVRSSILLNPLLSPARSRKKKGRKRNTARAMCGPD